MSVEGHFKSIGHNLYANRKYAPISAGFVSKLLSQYNVCIYTHVEHIHLYMYYIQNLIEFCFSIKLICINFSTIFPILHFFFFFSRC